MSEQDICLLSKNSLFVAKVLTLRHSFLKQDTFQFLFLYER